MATISLSKSEKAYIQSSLKASSSLRADGRKPHDYRGIALETGVAPLANGSARLNIGKTNHEQGGGTEVLAATKLEVEDIENGDGVEGGRIVCSVSCSPSAYPHVSYTALDDLQYDYTTLMQDILAHPSLHPPNLSILRGKKSWLLALDLVVLSDSGNIYDALFMAARAALWDTKVPRTRSVEYRANGSRPAGGNDMDVDQEKQSGLDTRQVKTATDFELEDYWDEGEPLGGRDKWPVCITLNLLPPLSYLDASLQEEAATPLRLLLMFSFKSQAPPSLQGMRLLGTDDINLSQISSLIKEGEKHAGELFVAINAKLKEEDIRRTEKARRRFAAVR
ncbi:ribosomal protein S5 domain 2-like protein [Dentipellis sp. KUC8613]|nr:ribosomal protein S5 domain 2-like protein [Dentipellis sp. KUC8613]